MFIDWMLIMRALGWQSVGVGLAAKQGVDRYKSNQSYRKEQNHYAPVDSWWEKYGVSESECDRFLTSYIRSAGFVDPPDLKDRVLRVLSRRVKSDDMYVKWLISSGGNNLASRMHVVILYYATSGRAARIGMWSMNKHFPMAGALESKPGLKAAVLQQLRENGVEDVHWYCDTETEQERRLNSM